MNKEDVLFPRRKLNTAKAKRFSHHILEMSTENSAISMSNLTNARSENNESIAPPVLQFTIGLTGNIAALVILIRSSAEHRWRPFYRFVGGLIASDLLSMILPYTFILRAYTLNSTIIYSDAALCGFISFTMIFSITTNAFTICAMSLDRFLAIIFPLTYRNLSKGFRISVTLLGIWISTAILCSLPLVGFGSYRPFYPGSWCFVNITSDDAKDKAVTYLYAVIGLLIIVATITLNAAVIFSLCWKFCKGGSRSAKDKRSDAFLITYLVAIVTLFTLCTTPMVLNMLINAATDAFNDKQVDLLTARLSVANVIIDPWIYLLFRRTTYTSIRRQARSLLRRFRMRQAAGEGESSLDTNTQNLSSRTDERTIYQLHESSMSLN